MEQAKRWIFCWCAKRVAATDSVVDYRIVTEFLSQVLVAKSLDDVVTLCLLLRCLSSSISAHLEEQLQELGMRSTVYALNSSAVRNATISFCEELNEDDLLALPPTFVAAGAHIAVLRQQGVAPKTAALNAARKGENVSDNRPPTGLPLAFSAAGANLTALSQPVVDNAAFFATGALVEQPMTKLEVARHALLDSVQRSVRIRSPLDEQIVSELTLCLRTAATVPAIVDYCRRYARVSEPFYTTVLLPSLQLHCAAELGLAEDSALVVRLKRDHE